MKIVDYQKKKKKKTNIINFLIKLNISFAF